MVMVAAALAPRKRFVPGGVCGGRAAGVGRGPCEGDRDQLRGGVWLEALTSIIGPAARRNDQLHRHMRRRWLRVREEQAGDHR